MISGSIVTLSEPVTAWRLHQASDSARRARARTYQLAQTIRRTRVFNHLVRQAGLPTITLWRNPRFYRQLIRIGIPDMLARLLYPEPHVHNSASAPSREFSFHNRHEAR